MSLPVLARESLPDKLFHKFWVTRRSKFPKWEKKRSHERILRAEASLLARFFNELEKQR